jgi:hypothetical protein
MNGWRCIKCSCQNGNEKPRCGFCSTPRPENNISPEEYADQKITKALHNAIEKLLPRQRNLILSYFQRLGMLNEIVKDENGKPIDPDLHTLVDTLDSLQKKKLYRYMEDNFL